MTKQCMQFKVMGKVQGVWYRDSTQKQAEQIGLTGWVRNLPDGSVEVLACGEPEQLKQLHQWLHQGSRLARVDSVQAKQSYWQSFEGFTVRYE